MERAGLKNKICIDSLKWENILNLVVNGSQLKTNQYLTLGFILSSF